MDRIERLKGFLKNSPDDSFVQHALALEYVKQGDDAQARMWFEGLLQKDENYVGSYYHLARLLERTHEKEAARTVYEKGLQVARRAGDQHAYNELQAAYENLMDY